MKTTLLSLLFLTGLAAAEPQFFSAAEPKQGNILLVAEDGVREAESLARAGYDCALSHASELKQVEADELWTRQKVGWEAHQDAPNSVTASNLVTIIGLQNKASLVWKLHRGVICVDPHPRSTDYDPLGPVKTVPYPGPGLPYESSLKPNAPLLLVSPDLEEATVQQLGPNCHKAAGLLTEDNSGLQKEVRRWLAIQQPLQRLGLIDSKFVPSPNWGVRSLGDRIDTLVVHSTVINTLEGTERAFFDDKERRVSAHYVVDRDGTTVQMVDERRTAWHAGVSELDGRTGVNDFSVGIELVNLNDGKDPYPEAQYQAVARILKDLRTRWDIPDEHVVSHAAIARPLGRKSDPVGFDFEKLRRMLDP
ncbi:N-acetylmuramoyl-L-alanine amidase [bacterium]|nr:N-acetylmuramoyl-L-alanine amidase [bacterium]